MFKNGFSSWLRDRGGNTAVIFALALVPLVGAAGGVTDMVRIHDARAKLQAATDNAALAAGAARGKTDAERRQLAERIFSSQFDVSRLKQPLQISISNDKVVVDAAISVPTTFLKMFGIDQVDALAHALVRMGSASPLELALVLDNTYSMHGTKIATLRKAAKTLVQQLHAAATSTRAELKIGLVPYARYVRLDKSYKGKWWLEINEQSHWVPKTCRWRDVPIYERRNCRTVPAPCPIRDGVPTGTNCTRRKCDWVKTGTERRWVCNGGYWWKSKWTGCVGSRPDPFYVTDGDYNTNKVPGMLSKDGHGKNDCPQPIVPLTNVTQAGIGSLVSVISHMHASGRRTYIPGGLKWGWSMLSDNEPLNEAYPYGQKKVKKAIVLMTDGENNVYANGTDKFHRKGSTAKVKANGILSRLCTNIKKKDIVIYTVAFEVTDPLTKNLLESCATSPGHYFDATSSAQLLAAFDAIGKSLMKVYLAE